ncbi:MAG TPA: hypothetical protein PKC96_05745 [Bacilli bacterium]|jgi:hypothetical protein|nr:hypothetical protein [Bacilli bacterium]
MGKFKKGLFVLLGFLVAAGLAGGAKVLNDHYHWTDIFGSSSETTSDTTSDDSSDNTSEEIPPVSQFHGRHVLSALGSANGETLTVTIEPANASNQNLQWTFDWEDTISEDVNEYLAVEPSGLTAYVYAIKPWSGNIIITVSLEGFSDTCTVNYYEVADGLVMNGYSTQTAGVGTQSFTGSFTEFTVQPGAYIGLNFTPTSSGNIDIDNMAMGYEIVSGDSIAAAEQIDPAARLFNFEAVGPGDTLIRFYVEDDPSIKFELTITVYQAVTGISLDQSTIVL